MPGQSREWNQLNVSIRGEIAQAVSSGTSNCISSERDLRRSRQWILARGLPAASVFVLVVWQIVALADDGVIVVHHPTGAVILAVHSRVPLRVLLVDSRSSIPAP